MRFNKDSLKTLRVALNEAVQQALKQHGITGTLAGASYSADGSNATFKLELVAPNESGVFIDRDAAAFKSYARAYDYDPDLLFTVVRHNGKQFKILGFLPRSAKFPVLAENQADGKKYKLPLAAIRKKTA